MAGLAILASCLVSRSYASTFSVTYGSTNIPVNMEPDTYYNIGTGDGTATWDQISTIFQAPVTTSDDAFSLKSSIYGRNYDSDPARPGTWGLLNRQTLTGFSQPPWLIKHGLAPEFVGSPQYFSMINGEWKPVDASYVAFEIELAPNSGTQEVMFDSVTLSIDGVYNTDGDVDIWASTNQNDFSNALKPKILATGDSDIYTWDFGPVNLAGKKLEVRVYGMLGLDQGTFGTTVMQGTFSPVTPVPEPTLPVLSIMGLLGCSIRRRR